ncbi:MAG: hypothetical protein P1V51_20515, partial [Deltaproteobacteria bacterium]|nr:hypothetical protein [Deltaproteobacteria bacterium]
GYAAFFNSSIHDFCLYLARGPDREGRRPVEILRPAGSAEVHLSDEAVHAIGAIEDVEEVLAGQPLRNPIFLQVGPVAGPGRILESSNEMRSKRIEMDVGE